MYLLIMIMNLNDHDRPPYLMMIIFNLIWMSKMMNDESSSSRSDPIMESEFHISDKRDIITQWVTIIFDQNHL
jgi:hypothetical protein